MKGDIKTFYFDKKIPEKIMFNGQEVNSIEFGEDVRWRIRVIATDSEYSMEDFFEDYGEMVEPPCEIRANNHLLAPIGMFKDCAALLKAPNFTMPKVENMHRLFYGCEKLSEQPPYDTTKVYDFTDYMNGCQALPRKFVLDIRSVTNADRMICSFEDCSVAQLFLLNAQPQVKKEIDIELLTGVGDDDDDDDDEPDPEDIKRREFSKNMKIIFGKSYKRISQDNYKMSGLYPNDYATMAEVIDAIDIEGLTSISSMFSGCSSLVELPWIDTSKVIDMTNAFNGCSLVKEFPDIDFSQVKTMSGTFKDCKNLSMENIPDLTAAINVTDISYAFYGCSALIYVPTVPTANISNMAYAFAGTGITSINDVDFSNVTNLQGTFEGCSQLKEVEGFVTKGASDMSRLFNGCSNLEYLPILDISGIKSVEGLRDMIKGTAVREIRFTKADPAIQGSINAELLGKPDVTVLFGTTKAIVGEDFGMDTVYGDAYESMTHIPDELDTSQLKFSYSMFGDMGELVDIPMIDISGSCDCSEMFISCTSLQHIPPLDTGSCEEFASMFQECYSLKEVPPINIGRVTSAKKMTNMFKSCGVTKVTFWNASPTVRKTLTPTILGKPTIEINFMYGYNMDLPVRVLTDDTCHIQELYLDKYEDMTKPIETFDTSQVTDMNGMYQNCKNLKKPDYHFTSKVVDMSGMFDNCIGLEVVPAYDTSNAIDMSAMFSQCTSLSTIPKLDTSKVTDFSDMFYNCWSLTVVPAINTSSAKSMIDMFFGCSSLKSVPVLDIRSITKAEDLRDMFFDTGVTKVSFSNASASVQKSITPALLGKADLVISFVAKK